MNTKVRLQTPEQLDDLELSGTALDSTLSSLKLINTLLGNHRQLYKAIITYFNANSFKKEFHVVDLGCGGGDSINYISKKLNKHKIKVRFTGIDGNPDSISYARKNNINPKHINFIVADILDKNFTVPDCDLLISSHFIYHFKNKDLTLFLKKMKKTRSEMLTHIIFSELYRTRVAYYLFKLISFMLPISDIAKKDGLIAIQRAFSIDELQKIIKNSGVKEFKVIKKPFFRMITKIDL